MGTALIIIAILALIAVAVILLSHRKPPVPAPVVSGSINFEVAK